MAITKKHQRQRVNPFLDIRMKTRDQERSMRWYREKIKQVGDTRFDPKELMSNKHLQQNVIMPGGLYLYGYDPKHKNVLPYYDTFPLTFIYKRAPNGFMGYNLHYLPYVLRFQLMGTLIDIQLSNDPETKKMLRSYGLLSQLDASKLFEPCIKRYLSSHVTSKFLVIPQEDWVTAAMLPIEQFQKASNQKVWYDSRKIIYG